MYVHGTHVLGDIYVHGTRREYSCFLFILIKIFVMTKNSLELFLYLHHIYV